MVMHSRCWVVICLMYTCWMRLCDSQAANSSNTVNVSANIVPTAETISITDAITVGTVTSTFSAKDRLTSVSPIDNKTENSTTIAIKNKSGKVSFNRKVCRYYVIPDARHLKDCCSYEYRKYKDYWVIGSYYLVTILERMQRWNCSQFRNECIHPTWPFTDYSRRIYDLFCDRLKLENDCYLEVNSIVTQYGFQSKLSDSNWKSLIERLDSSKMQLSDLTQPCIQAALYDRKDGGPGRFHEVIEPDVPFCGLQWHGYDYNTSRNREVSVWTGMSIWCRSSIIICMVIIVAASIATIIANILILAVFGTTPRMRNSQAIYKMSLAISDLLVGLVVWPNMIVMQYLAYWAPRNMGNIIKRPYYKTNSMTPYYGVGGLRYRYGGGVSLSVFPFDYVRAMGFLIMLGLMVSIYTLMVASFDRFLAVFKPLRYNRYNAKKQAIILSIIVWIVSIVVCIMPTFMPNFTYKVMSSILINLEGFSALIFVFIILLLPLLITWIITALTFHMSKKHARVRQKIVSTTNSSQALERRLAKTLSIMIGVFTLSVLPSVCCAIAGFASAVTDWTNPLNLNISAATAYTTSEYLSIVILTSNSLWNCFIYSLRTRGFRDVASSVLHTVSEKSGFDAIRRGAIFVVHGARRVSLSTMMNVRRFSTPDGSDVRKKSLSSMTGTSKISESSLSSSARPSVDLKESSIFGVSSSDNITSSKYTRSGGKASKATSGVEIRVERKKAMKKEEEEYVGDDSTFGSFAIDARTDRLFESVMESVPEKEDPV